MAETIILNNHVDYGFLAKVYQEQVEDLTEEIGFVRQVLDGEVKLTEERTTEILERYRSVLIDKCEHTKELIEACKAAC